MQPTLAILNAGGARQPGQPVCAQGTDGGFPNSLIRDAAGNLYGTATLGGDPTCGCVVVFKIALE
ncbi:MAG TPA: hypothetical protein VHW45_12450 [Candidatus Sulfotelmatobacter sp.]|nr:hypothetical protein [Candidatus Sulfotelmatobacter sp.]